MELLAAGRASQVYALDDARVLRRCAWDVAAEARLMTYLRGHGYPLPEVHEAEGGDMVMQRLAGPTLAAAMAAGETTSAQAARIQDDLLAALAAIPVPDWLPTEARGIDLGAPSAILHLDLHAQNVLLTAEGPFAIDWTNAAAGDPAIDRAVSWTIIAELDAAAFPVDLAPLRDLLARDLPAAAVATALRYREADPNTTPEEHARARSRAAGLVNP
ncbi:Phosphotransferase enzyme family protein [Glycomyces sambucus]|uniref:Phosphotransferase enzyme family protein n=1 Tax=Glycomyces sambucus TaxID=380244 RepID=A0A1G9CX75_9ACTN|nr:phosphotransferase [Glycomyces sambucus]SDK56232.1 Phosphotransferase enzyme family protein [Glycomyces sambucus]